ncbi:MAG TPA: RNA polymerase sigma factor [Frankiaceae bacterium]|jgi:RNA polymerase sigma-70 factor (ECF subfamily)|nr:RNA polymerase sigma factor [Frankiaceae bacterium]
MELVLTATEPPHAARAASRRRARETDDGFREFYEREYANIAGYAFLLVRDEESARDIAQEAFTRLLTRFVSVREPRPYLFLVVTNLARDRWKRARRERETYALLVADERPVEAADVTVQDAVESLPEPMRTCVRLYYFADLPVPEVAAVVRRPEGTVKRLLSEARTRLAKALGDDDA